jgi:hypothetical protein
MNREQLVAQMAELQTWVESMPVQDLLDQLEPLQSSDHELIGRLVQLMCFIDFNGRRAASALQSAPTYTGRKLDVGRMQDGQVIDHLKKLIEAVDLPSEEKSRGLKAMDIISGIANRRHHLAHWAARRFPQADAVIIMTMNAKEGGRHSGIDKGQDEFIYGLMSLIELKNLLAPLLAASDFLSPMAAEWTKRFVEEKD